MRGATNVGGGSWGRHLSRGRGGMEDDGGGVSDDGGGREGDDDGGGDADEDVSDLCGGGSARRRGPVSESPSQFD